MLFDPRLMLSPGVAAELEVAGWDGDGAHVLVTDAYHVPLAFEGRSGGAWVRAATGDEVTDFLCTEACENGEGREWPGDEPASLGFRISWRDRPVDELQSDQAVQLFSGEVIFRSGRGVAGPFFVHQTAAASWAFSTALEHESGEVFECHVVPYACARQAAPELLRQGDVEARRLSRLDVSPLRPLGQPRPVLLPWQQPVGETEA